MRPRLPDTSARKQLAALLLLRLKLPGDRGTAAKEAVSLLVETRDSQQLQEAFGVMEESDIVTLLSSLDEAAVNQLRVAMLPCDLASRELVDKELARRLASRLNEERLKRLWELLQGHLDTEQDSWARAAACLLSVHIGRIEVKLGNLSLEVLVQAGKFLDDQDLAISFAQDFFSYDLGISTAEQWPLRSSAPIFCELAGRISEDESAEKLQLLVKAHGIDESHSGIRATVYKLLHAHMLSREARGESTMEGLFLKLALEEGGVPVEVLPKLTLSECHLKQASPEQLMNLCQQLVASLQQADAARVAVFGANAFAAKGQARESEEAFLKAFAFDGSNQEAAEGLASAVTSAHRRCDELEKNGSASNKRFQGLEAQCQVLQRRCATLESQEAQRQAFQKVAEASSIVWDLSSYDFSNFTKERWQESEKFQLLSSGVMASLHLCPKGQVDSAEGLAPLYLSVNKPCIVKWTWQTGSGQTMTLDHVFGKDMNGQLSAWGGDFIPVSQVNGSIIILRILSVQLQGSSLSLMRRLAASAAGARTSVADASIRS